MSGLGGFAPISNNTVHQPAIQPGANAQPQNIQNARNEPPQNVPAGNADEARAQSFVRSLDVLLSRAGKAAGQAVDEAALAKIVKGAKFDKATVASLRATAKAANDAMRALDGFSGADFATAMVRDKQTGLIGWKGDSYVGKAVQDALDKQQALSDALTKLLNNLPEKASAEQQAALEEAMLQCDRRLSEVESVVLELTETAAEQGILDKGILYADANTKARLNRRVVDLADEKALEMHDRSLALQTFQKQLAPVVQQLENYAANPGQAVPANQLTAFRRVIGEAKNAIANAAKNGVVQVPKEGGGTRELFVDRTFLDEAAKLLGEAEAKLGKLRESAARDLRRKFVEKEVRLPAVDLLQPKFAARLRELGGTPDQRKQVAAVADLIEGLEKFRKALLAYAEKPSSSNKSHAYAALDELRDADGADLWKAGLDVLLGGADSRLAANDPELRHAFEKFRDTFANNKAMKSLTRELATVVWCGEVMVDHLEALSARAKNSREFGGTDAVRSVFFGEGSFTTLIESRVHGYADGDIDPALDDRNVVDSRRLGSGGFNTVNLVTFKDGTKRVFKPEFAGRMAAENSPILTGIDTKQEMTRINRAVNRTADALGLGDVMVKTTAGVHGGVFGMYMEAAPGEEARRLARNAYPVYGTDGNQVALGTDEIKALPDDQRKLVRGRMMRQFNRLQWFDVITGQGDRHDANYMVQVKPDLTVVAKAIDNDASFGVIRTGISTYRLNPDKAKKYMERVRNLSIAYGTKSTLAVNEVTHDPGFKKLRDGSIEVDISKAKSALTVAGLYETTAFHLISVPDEMDYELYERLMQLRRGPDRDALLKDWADKLGARSQQYRFAVTRLDEAIARAEQLKNDGKVYRAEDWEGDEVQNRILKAPFPQDPTAEILGQAPKNQQGRTLVGDYQYMMAGNLYVRDFGSWE